MRRVLAVFFAIALLATGCGGGESGPAAGARPSSPVQVSIVEPKPGAALTGERFTVRINLVGGRIVKETTRDTTPTTEGHVHVSVDGNILSQTFGLTQQLETPKAGRHLLQVEFVAKDHGPFNPRRIASRPFEVMR